MIKVLAIDYTLNAIDHIHIQSPEIGIVISDQHNARDQYQRKKNPDVDSQAALLLIRRRR